MPPLTPVNPSFLVLLTIRLSLVSTGVPLLFWRWTAWGVSRSLLEGISHSLWLMSGILSLLKQASFNPPEPALFNTNLKYTILFTMILYINRIHDSYEV